MAQDEKQSPTMTYLAAIQKHANTLAGIQEEEKADRSQSKSLKSKFSDQIWTLCAAINQLPESPHKEAQAKHLKEMLDAILGQKKQTTLQTILDATFGKKRHLKDRHKALDNYWVLTHQPSIREYAPIFFLMFVALFVVVGSVSFGIIQVAEQAFAAEVPMKFFTEILPMLGREVGAWFTGIPKHPGVVEAITYIGAGVAASISLLFNFVRYAYARTRAQFITSNNLHTSIEQLITQAAQPLMCVQLACDMFIQYDPITEQFFSDPTLETIAKQAGNRGTIARTLLRHCNKPVPKVDIYAVPPEATQIPQQQYPQYATISLRNADMFDCSDKLLDQGKEVSMEDAANKSFVGGGVFKGTKEQEEQFCHDSNLSLALLKLSIDKMPEGAMLYDANEQRPRFFPDLQPNQAFVIKGVTYHHPGQPERQVTAFGNAAMRLVDSRYANKAAWKAAGRPPVNKQQLTRDNEKDIRSLIRAELYALWKAGEKTAVFCGRGLGAFNNDPSLVGQWYAEEILLGNYHQYFTHIQFSIRDRDGSIYNAFSQGFNNGIRQMVPYVEGNGNGIFQGSGVWVQLNDAGTELSLDEQLLVQYDNQQQQWGHQQPQQQYQPLQPGPQYSQANNPNGFGFSQHDQPSNGNHPSAPPLDHQNDQSGAFQYTQRNQN